MCRVGLTDPEVIEGAAAAIECWNPEEWLGFLGSGLVFLSGIGVHNLQRETKTKLRVSKLPIPGTCWSSPAFRFPSHMLSSGGPQYVCFRSPLTLEVYIPKADLLCWKPFQFPGCKSVPCMCGISEAQARQPIFGSQTYAEQVMPWVSQLIPMSLHWIPIGFLELEVSQVMKLCLFFKNCVLCGRWIKSRPSEPGSFV